MLCKLAVAKGMIQHLVLLVDHLGRGLLKSKASKLAPATDLPPTAQNILGFKKGKLKIAKLSHATLELVWSFLASTTLNLTWARTLAGLNLECRLV